MINEDLESRGGWYQSITLPLTCENLEKSNFQSSQEEEKTKENSSIQMAKSKRKFSKPNDGALAFLQRACIHYNINVQQNCLNWASFYEIETTKKSLYKK